MNHRNYNEIDEMMCRHFCAEPVRIRHAPVVHHLRNYAISNRRHYSFPIDLNQRLHIFGVEMKQD